MLTRKFFPIFALAAIFAGFTLACRIGAPAVGTETGTPALVQQVETSTATTAPSDTPTSPPSETPTEAGTPAPCEIVGLDGLVTIYNRPGLEADVFAQVSQVDFPWFIGARTADGWLGFDPAVAQAANMGVFRFRWVQSEAVITTGDCDRLPVVEGPPPGLCFTMPMLASPVYDAPDATSNLITTLVPEQYAAVTGLAVSGWARVDLAPGNSGLDATGWMAQETLNFNGPCSGLPVAAP